MMFLFLDQQSLKFLLLAFSENILLKLNDYISVSL